MGKITKSVRLDSDVEKIANDYCRFLQEVYNIDMTFSKLVPNALLTYIADQMEDYERIMRSESFVKISDSGKIIPYHFSEEEIAAAADLQVEAFCLMQYYDTLKDKENKHE